MAKRTIEYFDKPMEEVTLDKIINKKQIPMYRNRNKPMLFLFLA